MDFETADGTANGSGPNPDYTPRTGTLTFGASKVATFQVPITRDTLHEAAETVLLRLSNPQPAIEEAALGFPNTAVLTIVDNDLGGKVQFSPATYSVDASSSAPSVTLKVTRLGGSASGVTVHYQTGGGTASAGADYEAASGDLTFPSSGPGATTQTFTVGVSENTGPSKHFFVTLPSAGGGATLGAATSALVQIAGVQPVLGFGSDRYDATTNQPAATITVLRTAPLGGTTSVHYATSDGSTGAGAHYKATSGDLTFAPGAASRTFTVPILRDAVVDSPSTVNLTLSSPSPGSALDPSISTAILVLTDPNLLPTVGFSAATYAVPETFPKAAVQVLRKGDLTGTVAVGYQVTGGTATNGVDYDLAAGTLTFAQNQSSQTLFIPIRNDKADDGTETILLALAAPTWTVNGVLEPAPSLGQATTTVEILDSGPTVQFGAAGFSTSEASKSFLIPVRRLGSVVLPATVAYDVTGGTANRDTGAGGDYKIVAPGVLSFAAHVALQTIAVTLEPDSVVDGSKTVALTLSTPSGVALGTPSTTELTIHDANVAGEAQFSVAVSSVPESIGQAMVTVTRTGGSATATVHYATLDANSGTTAVAGTDYQSTSGTLTFDAAHSSQTFSLAVIDDGVPDSGAVSVVLGLDQPAGGLALGPISRETLWIVRE